MASSKANNKAISDLREYLGNSLPVDIIQAVASECNYDVESSLNLLLEMTTKVDNVDTRHKKPTENNKPKVKKHTSSTPSKLTPGNKSTFHTSSSEQTVANKSKKSLEIERVVQSILKGYKILVILRGVPGCGKTRLAHSITDACLGPGNNSHHILSTDDFFMQRSGYIFDPQRLPQAHDWNHTRAFDAMSRGLSPVIIDNTNTQMWEMKPYATMATDYGYIVEIIEPDTWWCFNDKELARRNIHNVPKAKIREMIERYDKHVTAQKLLAAYNLQYKFQKPPQMRLVPPIVRKNTVNNHSNGIAVKSESMFTLDFGKNFAKSKSPSKSYETINLMDFTEEISNNPRNQHQVANGHASGSSSMSVDDILMCSEESSAKILQPVVETSLKRGYEHDVHNAWGVDPKTIQSWEFVTPLSHTEPSISTKKQHEPTPVEMQDGSSCVEPRDFQIISTNCSVPEEYAVLIANSRDINAGRPNLPYCIPKKIMVDKSSLTEDTHEPDDEAKQIKGLMDLFPKIPQSYLVELYNKCQKNFDWTVDVLLEDNSENILDTIKDTKEDTVGFGTKPIEIVENNQVIVDNTVESRETKFKQKFISESSRVLKKEIEEKFDIGNQHYSEHVLKVKHAKFGSIQDQAGPSTSLNYEDLDESDNDSGSSDYDDNPKNQVELNLGTTFVSQLETLFGGDNAFPQGFQPVVQMPATLARQIYSLYIESICEQMDAQENILKRLEHEDEEFARQLQRKEEENIAAAAAAQKDTSVPDFNEIMNEQAAISIHQREADEWKNMTVDNLAAKLTRQKLFASFPTIDRNALLEILHAYGNDYNKTVQDLIASVGASEHASTEHIKQPPLSSGTILEMREAERICTDVQELEESKPAVYYREEANKHIRRREELYEKAKSYYQKGMTEVAMFYSSLAKKETRLYDQANSFAAATFTEEHSRKLQKFDTLDLHYLYVKEAITHLDIFIDRNINLLKGGAKNVQELYVITGRGKNSEGGVSKIKPAVITRLKKRKINFSQLNPGLLKIKVYQTSATTNEVN